MTALQTYTEEQVISHAMDENIVASLYDRAQMIINVFLDDGLQCMEMTHQLFRNVIATSGLSEYSVYAGVTEAIKGLKTRRVMLDGVSSDDLLCWLLKESSTLSYAEIAEMTGFTRGQVAEGIAAVRSSLLS